jgi:hypothetical protein
MHRRTLLGFALGFAAMPIVSCTSTGTIDVQKVLDGLKVACGIAVPAATVTSIINASVGATVQSIVDLLCSGFHTTMAAEAMAAKKGGMAAPAPLAVGASVDYDVIVNGKPIHVVATKT